MIDLAVDNQTRSDPMVERLRFRTDLQRTPRDPTSYDQKNIDQGWEEYDRIVQDSIVGVTGVLNLTVGLHPIFSKPARYMTLVAAVTAGLVATGIKWTAQATDLDEWIYFKSMEDYTNGQY